MSGKFNIESVLVLVKTVHRNRLPNYNFEVTVLATLTM